MQISARNPWNTEKNPKHCWLLYSTRLYLKSCGCFLVQEAERMLTLEIWFRLYTLLLVSAISEYKENCFPLSLHMRNWVLILSSSKTANSRMQARRREEPEARVVASQASFTTNYLLRCSLLLLLLTARSTVFLTLVIFKASFWFTALHLLELVFQKHMTETAFTPFAFWRRTFKSMDLKMNCYIRECNYEV